MASRRKGPALFEVIRAAQQKQQEQQRKLEEARHQPPGMLHNAAALLGSPSFWLAKGKKALSDVNTPTEPRKPVMRSISKPVQAPVHIPTPVVEAAPKPSFTPAPQPVVEPEPVVEVAAETRAEAATSEIAPPVSTTYKQPVYRQVSHKPDAAIQKIFHEPEPAHPAHESPAAAAARSIREEIAATSVSTSDDVAEAVFVEPKSNGSLNSLSDLFNYNEDQLSSDPAPASRWSRFPLKLNYTTGVVAGCILLGAVAVAIVVSRGGSSDGNVVLADGKVHPNVLDVKPPGTVKPAPAVAAAKIEAPAPRPPAVAPSDPAIARANLNPQPNGVKSDIPDKPIKIPTNVKREVGKQYLVLLSFPRDVDANELVKFLADNGIPVTAEKGLAGYSKSWYSVVTTRGFAKTQGVPEFDQYSGKISKLMEKYARGSKFKTFKPDLYTWRGAN